MAAPVDPYDFAANTPAVAAQVDARFAALFAALAHGGLDRETLASQAWAAYTPTAAGLTVGSGGALSGAYAKYGRTVHVRGVVVFGTGASITANPLVISLPVQAGADYQFGAAEWWDASASLLLLGHATVQASASVFAPQFPTLGASLNQAVPVTPTEPTPIAPAVNDTIRWQFAYESAS